MICTRCLRNPFGAPVRSRISASAINSVSGRPLRTPSTPRAFSILCTRRPRILASMSNTPSPSISSTLITPTLDLLPKISSHPSLAGIQVRNGPRDTFNPSHRVRKRRHGFLSRIKTRKGRNTLKRRLSKSRSKLSH
ncbi:hypothetical protein EJ08DRAFT_634817 [Tothia fuscella]|uniref:Large ribosomal subunit protein bL34m n=1 Tax=Tothia fuscella TaxID=1048955 RepID=A0A9P4NRH0_9PEZI|nr:hypothetical protein EJ08DRAFT_634817 [Tothia fuscella]